MVRHLPAEEEPHVTVAAALSPGPPPSRSPPSPATASTATPTQGQTYPGVTSILRVLDKSDALMAWASRNTAEAALAQLDHLAGLRDTVGPEGVVKALTARSAWKRDEAAAAGSDIHGLAERIARGEPLPDVSPIIRARVEAYAAWWAGVGLAHPARRGLRRRAHPGLRRHPRPARLRRDRPDRPRRRQDRARTSTQRWCCSSWPTARPPSSPRRAVPLAYPMPTIERYVVLHVTDAGVRVIDVEVDDDDRAALRACLPLSRWHAARKGQRL